MMGFYAMFGVYQIIPVPVSIVLITLFDCVTIAAAIPMQMTSSIILQTGVEKNVLGRVSATLRMIGIASGAACEMLFGLINDATWVWLPIFLGALGVGTAALFFKRTMSSSDIDARQNNKGEQNGTV